MILVRLAWWLTRGAPAAAGVLILCLAVAVAGRVSVGSLGRVVELVIAGESRGILGGDLELSGASALTEVQQKAVLGVLPSGSHWANQRTCTTMATTVSGQTRAVELRAVPPEWPLVGRLVLDSAADLQVGPVCAVQPDLLRQLNCRVGDVLRLGRLDVRIAGVIVEEPGAFTTPFQLGPRVLVSAATLDATGLAGFGARIRHALLVTLADSEPAAVAALAKAVHRALGQDPEAQAPPGSFGPPQQGIAVKTAAEAQGQMVRVVERLGDWLRLASLLALILGGLGIATLVRGMLVRTAGDRAVLAILGAGPRRLAMLTVIQVTGLAFVGGLLGSALGGLIAGVIVRQSGLPPGIPVVDPVSLGLGVLLAVGAALVFAAGPLLETAGQRPLAILRGDAPVSSRRGLLGSVAVIPLLLGLAAVETRSLITGPAVIAGALVAGGLLALLFRVVLPGIGRLALFRRGPWTFALGHGLGNLGRPGLRAVPAATTLGLGAVLLGVLLVYRASVSGELAAESRGTLPTLFAIDLQDDQVEDFRRATPDDRGELAPIVRARFRGIVGREAPVPAGSAGDEAKFFRAREQNLSWRTSPGADETLLAGRWATGEGECTLESGFATRLGAGIGDKLRFDVQGVPLELTVTGLRQVRWLGFRPNFFILTDPQSLAGAPTTWIAALAPTGDRLAVQLRLTKAFPNLTILDLATIARRVQGLTDRLAWAVAGIAGLALVAGLLVLGGMVLESARRRREDAAILACLGLPRGPLALSLAVEFSVLGLVAGMAGLVLAVPGGLLVVRLLLKLPVSIPWEGILLTLPILTGLTALAGVLAAGQVLRARPLEVLRSD